MEGLGGIGFGALVLMAFALAMSRRSLGISTFLCFCALGILAYGFFLWARLE
jgi:hypothetical protein